MTGRATSALVAWLVLMAWLAPAGAQPASGPPNALQGFSQNRDQPVKIDAASLEVRDKEKIATFSGNVHLVQGDTTLRSKTLAVFYDRDPGSGSASVKSGNMNQQQIRRIEVKGGVVVTQKEQTATGESGVFDMDANSVMLMGNVVISHGPQVIKGDRLIVDLTTGVSRVECDKANPQCRVQALIMPGAAPRDPRSADSPAGKETPRPRASHPSGLY
jgi:lipopolysaccharide export system protein LptA